MSEEARAPYARCATPFSPAAAAKLILVARATDGPIAPRSEALRCPSRTAAPARLASKSAVAEVLIAMAMRQLRLASAGHALALVLLLLEGCGYLEDIRAPLAPPGAVQVAV
jgi:hypothetical protein